MSLWNLSDAELTDFPSLKSLVSWSVSSGNADSWDTFLSICSDRSSPVFQPVSSVRAVSEDSLTSFAIEKRRQWTYNVIWNLEIKERNLFRQEMFLISIFKTFRNCWKIRFTRRILARGEWITYVLQKDEHSLFGVFWSKAVASSASLLRIDW